MLTFSQMPGVEINVIMLVFLGFAVGIASGFIGVGGGFVLTPALIILGFPANFAVGTSMSFIAGTSIMAATRHRQMGNIDIKLGSIMIVGMLLGVEVGVRILNQLTERGISDSAVLAISIITMSFIGIYTFIETSRQKKQINILIKSGESAPSDIISSPIIDKIRRINVPPMISLSESRIRVSLWIILVIGMTTGILAGMIGVGGGFLMTPALIYMLGVPSVMAIGTDIYQIVFSGAFGCIRQTMSGNVIIITAFIMILGAAIGTQIGCLGTRYARGLSVRLVLAYSICFFTLASILKFISLFAIGITEYLNMAAVIIVFTGLGILVSIIAGLFFFGIRYSNGYSVPRWLKSLLVKYN
jgi:uncharacterized protein